VEIVEVHRPGDPEASRGPTTLILPDSHLAIPWLDPLDEPFYPDKVCMAGKGDACEEAFPGDFGVE